MPLPNQSAWGRPPKRRAEEGAKRGKFLTGEEKCPCYKNGHLSSRYDREPERRKKDPGGGGRGKAGTARKKRPHFPYLGKRIAEKAAAVAETALALGVGHRHGAPPAKSIRDFI
jgi:hypothetical protein